LVSTGLYSLWWATSRMMPMTIV